MLICTSDCEWIPQRWQASENETSFVSVHVECDEHDDEPAMHMYKCEGGWRVVCILTDTVLLSTPSTALHPCSIYQEAWTDGADEKWSIQFYETDMDMTSQRTPLPLHRIGMDYFNRVSKTKVFWYSVCIGGERFVNNTGTKRSKGRLAGKKYCYHCKNNFSSANWPSQHVKLVHGTSAT